MPLSWSNAVAAALAVGAAAHASPREGATWTGVDSNSALGEGENIHRLLEAAGSYPVTRIRVNGTLNSVLPTTYALEARLRVTPPSGAPFTIQPFTGDLFTTVSTDGDLIYELATPVASAAGVWDVEFFDSFNDGPGADSAWSTVTFTLDDEAPPPPPANDACGGAIPTAAGGVYPGSTRTATNDAPASCGSSSGSKDVWYAFVAPTDGTFSFSTCDAFGFDTVMSLWDACGGSELACDDDTDYGCDASGLLAEVHRPMLAGQAVLVRIAGYNGASGDFTLRVAEIAPPPPPPVNDDCAGTLAAAEGAGTPFDTTSAAAGGVAVAGCGLPLVIHHDVYFSHQATCTGELTVSTCGTSYDTVLAVFDACGGAQIACADDGCDGSNPPGSTLASSAVFAATQGTVYIIAVGSYSADGVGPGVLNISCSPSTPTCNADFNGDGFLDFFDYDDYVACFESGACPPERTADFNGDGFADFFDYDDFVAAFEVGC